MEPSEPNVKAVKELILDEHKLVTYISLSKELCIHVNEAKSLLSQVIQDIRKAQPKTVLSVSYVISGLLNNNSGCTSVCSEADLDALKKKLKCIFYEHVYCVRRGSKSVENVALTAINQFDDLPLCTGLIKSNSCTRRANDEMQELKLKNHDYINAPRASNQVQQKEKVADVKGQKTVKKEDNIKVESKIKSEKLSPKKETSNNNKTSTSTSSNKTGAKSIAGFFNKVNGDSSQAKKKTKSEIKVEKNLEVIKTTNTRNVSSDVETATTNTSAKIENTNKNNGLTQITKNAKVDKKRKRLLHVSDSESESEEDIFNNGMDVDHDSEDEIPPTPTVNTVKVTSGLVNPKKRRKIVDKTYTDEDGYILTKKEEVYESCSDNEEPAKDAKQIIKENNNQETENGLHVKDTTKKNKENANLQIKTETSPKESKAKKKKVSPPQKGKQSTINSFFKKV